MIRRNADLLIFLAVAFGLSWLIAAPLWFTGGLRSPAFVIVGVAMMTTPSLGVLAVWWTKNRTTGARAWARHTGLTFGTSKKRTFILLGIAWIGTPALVIAALAISAALGLVSIGPQNFSLLQLQFAGRKLPISVGTLALIVVAAVTIAPFVNAIAAFFEEWGWRGWLLPRLTRFGVLPALLISGVIWGLWHAPLTLLGYNYPQLGAWAAPMFVGTCVLFGILSGWLRLRTGSIWPSVLAHGSLNATAGLPLLLGDAAHPPQLAIVGITGVVGWVLLAAIAVAVLKIWPVTKSDCLPEPVVADSAGADQTRTSS
jgi:membrane protease YdiL (CAAX protease family)